MIIEKYDIAKRELLILCGRDELIEVPGYIANLILIAEECRLDRLIIRHCGELPHHISRIVGTLIERNPWISVEETQDTTIDREDFAIDGITRSENFLLLREDETGEDYSMLVPADKDGAELASRSAYLIANLLGFSGTTAFNVRFGIYEILMNGVEHDMVGHELSWIQIRMSKKDQRLSVTIIDKGGEFDPTSKRKFELDEYVTGGKRRGLGLILMQKMYESFQYERKNGLNRIFFDRTLPSVTDGEKEDEMSSMQIGEFVRLDNGVTRIALSGDLDAKGALALENLMRELLEKEIHNIALDFEDVHFVSSAGIGMLLGLTSTMRDEGGEVWLTRVSQQVVSVFALLNLDDFFVIRDSEEEIVLS
jgi:anti-sigma B factor antagonist